MTLTEQPQPHPLPPLPARRCIATIRAELRRWQATARRQAWAGTVDSVVGARIHALRLELWRDWRVMS